MADIALKPAGRVILIIMAFLKRAKKEKTEPGSEEKKADKMEKIENSSKKENDSAARKSGLMPHITEKATFLGEKGAYVFKIKPSFNKIMVKEAVRKHYGVSPVKVRIINIPSSQIFIKRRTAVKPGFKKALVYLKKGDKIA